MKILLRDVRLAFPALWRRAVFGGEEGKFGATFLLNKTTQADQIKVVSEGITTMCKADLKGVKLPPDKLCLRDGDASEYDGFGGHMSLKASNNGRPLVIHRDKSVITEDDGIIYAGCYVNAQINLWSQDNQWGKRVNANLLGVQFVRDGEPFGDGGRIARPDEFDTLMDEGGGDGNDLFS